MQIRYVSSRPAILLGCITTLFSIATVSALVLGRIERIPTRHELAVARAPLMLKVKEDLGAEIQKGHFEQLRLAQKAYATLSATPELQLPRQEFTKLVGLPCKGAMISHPNGKPYRLMLSVPQSFSSEEMEKFLPGAVTATLACEERFEQLRRYGTPVPAYLQDPESMRLQFRRVMSLVVNELVGNSDYLKEAELWDQKMNVMAKLDQTLGWENGLLAFPTLDVALSPEESALKAGYSMVCATPYFNKSALEEGEQVGKVPAAWECNVWEYWSVLRDREGRAMRESDYYAPESKADIVGHVWAWYALADGRLDIREEVAVAHNPLSHLMVALGYTWADRISLSDPDLRGRIPSEYLNKLRGHNSASIDIVLWTNHLMFKGADAQRLLSRQDDASLLDLPGVNLLGFAPYK